MKKTSVLVFLVACSALFVACTHGVSTDTTGTASGDLADPQQPVTMEEDVTTIRVKAGESAFDPPVIRVRKDQKVRLALESESGTHGFDVPQLGLTVQMTAGQPMVLELPTNKPGTYVYIDSVAGAGTGQLVIE